MKWIFVVLSLNVCSWETILGKKGGEGDGGVGER